MNRILIRMLIAIIALLGCGEKTNWKIRSGTKLQISYQPGEIKEGAEFHIDSIVIQHGKNNNERLLNGDTIFLNSTEYYFTGSEGKKELVKANPAEFLNKLNFILKNYQPFSSRYITSPEMSTLKTGKLELSRKDHQNIEIRYPEHYPISIEVLDSLKE